MWQAHFSSSILTILPKLSAKLGHLLFIDGYVGKVPIVNIWGGGGYLTPKYVASGSQPFTHASAFIRRLLLSTIDVL